VVVATGLRLRGAGGRLTARLVPHGIDQFAGRGPVLVGPPEGPWTPFEVESHRVYDGKVAVKFRGVDDASRARDLVGMDISLPCKGLVDLPEGSYYIFQLVGLKVATSAGRAIGVVRDVLQTGGTPLLAVEPVPGLGSAGEEILLPAARSICRDIDTRSGVITIDPPEGLLELYGV
jgi:16S rRNA processing protein RimM